ncbi:hypothetical protein NC652_007361 [Populus alba x Populus x berolinensis]|nr:hypothetical protein NC652_007361 [Populus alba x Populus x berolinensis]
MDARNSEPVIEIVIEQTAIPSPHRSSLSIIEQSLISILARLHAGYFRISLALCSQALLWKILGESPDDAHALRRMFRMLPSIAFVLLWSLALFSLASLSLLYILRCLYHFEMVKAEFLHHVGVNYLFAPWISWLLLLQSSPFITPKTMEEVFISGGESDQSAISDREFGRGPGCSGNGVEGECCLYVLFGHGTLSCPVCYTISKVIRGQQPACHVEARLLLVLCSSKCGKLGLGLHFRKV